MTYDILHFTFDMQPMDQWTNGLMDQWTNGPMVQWTNGHATCDILLWHQFHWYFKSDIVAVTDIYETIITIRAPFGANKREVLLNLIELNP